jgi:elongator complex protein 1
VDLNLLHDYAPSQFLECIELFVQQLKKIEHIDLVLSQLRYITNRLPVLCIKC